MFESDAVKGNLPDRIKDTFTGIKELVHAALLPLPTETGDGSYIEKKVPTHAFRDLHDMGFDGVGTLIDSLKAGASGEPTDDRKYLMENVVKLASGLQPTSKLGVDLTNSFVNKLWKDLLHPPVSSLGEKYRYRHADGSHNNISLPMLGAANTPYARTVRPQTLLPANLPEPEVLFDSIMVRKEFTEHPNKISSVLFYLASIIIHDLFRTDHNDFNNSMTSSYLDLAPLYGSNQDEQNLMRTGQDGKIKADCFSERRLLGFPPGVGVLLIMFNRFHNHVVEELARINESGRFTKPKEGTPASAAKDSVDPYAKYDNDLFQTGRLITCGLYINCILKDYVRTILNLNRTDSTWDLDPRVQEGNNIFVEGAPEGVGNQVSAEFNLVYRWHAAISQRDDEWTQQAYRDMFSGKKPSEVTLQELMVGLKKWEKSIPSDPQKRPFAKLERKNGSLDDDDLVKIITESVDDVAGAFGANKVPEVLRAVEVLGIKQARSWNLATLNEFRSYFNLKKHENFTDINPDPQVAEQLKHLYDHPDFVELYPGLVVEEAKRPENPGSGLCPSYTVSRAVLSDAVALVRGDRFYTVDYTPKNLTNWGYNEVNFNVGVDQGHVFHKLFLRAFPNHFKPNSIYAHFPLVIPPENERILKHLGIADRYSWDKPSFVPHPTFITSYGAAKSILNNQIDFKVTWGEAITFLMEHSNKPYGADFMLAGDNEVNTKSREMMKCALYRDRWHQEVKSFYENITLRLLREKSYKLAGANQVDIVRDVGNLAQAHFCANIFSLPLKTKEHPLGIFSESQLYGIMALVFTCIFFDADPANSFPLRQAARRLTQQLGRLTMANVDAVRATGGFLHHLAERLHQRPALSEYGVHMIQRLLDSGLDAKDIVWSQILPTAGGMVANQAQLFAQTLDYFLSEGKEHLSDIKKLAEADTPEADEKILHYFMEGSRMKATVMLHRDVVKSTTIRDGDKEIHVKPGQRLMISASMDPDAFKEPDKLDLNRSLDSYIHYGMGPHLCLGYDISKVALTAMLKTVARLDNLRRAPGVQGQMKKIPGPGGFTAYMLADQSSYFPFPTTMKVQWDGDLPSPK